MLKRTPFYDFHLKAGAKIVPFAGWEMPLYYRSIIDEHNHTRNSGSIFDVSHMGRIHFTGKDAGAFLNTVCTRNLAEQKVGQSKYSLVCNESGGVLDDVIVSRDSKHWLMVCNASNREKLLHWFHEVRHKSPLDFDMADQTESTAMIAFQGPRVIEKMAQHLPVDLANLKRYHFETGSVMMLIKVTVFRSGYTGEDGVEIILSSKVAGMAMKMLAGSFEKQSATIKMAGLGARDTLRLEAAMPLYGHEITETTDPLTAGLGWAVDLNKEFIGVSKLREIAAVGPKRKLVGLELEGPRIARQDTPVLKDGVVIGHVTSGTMSPTLGKSIAMALVDSNHTAEGTQLTVDLRGTPNPAKIVKMPFYSRPK